MVLTGPQFHKILGGDLYELKIAQSNNLVMFTSKSDKLYTTTTGSGTWAQLTNYTGGFINLELVKPTQL